MKKEPKKEEEKVKISVLLDNDIGKNGFRRVSVWINDSLLCGSQKDDGRIHMASSILKKKITKKSLSQLIK